MSSPPFPVAHSVLSSAALAERVLSKYELPAAPSCRYFRRGVNDTYLVKAGQDAYFLRVYRAGWRSRSAVAAELAMLLHLARKGVRVSHPLPRKDGSYLTQLRAPEGIRWAVLFTRAAGASFPVNDRNSFSYGAAAARVHAGLDEQPRDPRRFHLDFDHLVWAPLRTITPFLSQRPRDLEELQAIGNAQTARIGRLVPISDISYGWCHGDLHLGNVHMDGEGNLTLFDFDCSGYGWRAYDLSVFLWSLGLRNGDSKVGRSKTTRRWNAFLRGYRSIRPLSAAEAEAAYSFVALRHLWLMGLHAGLGDVVGTSGLNNAYFNRGIGFIRRWVSYHRL